MAMRFPLDIYYRFLLTILIFSSFFTPFSWAAEPAACLSSDPSQWPQPSKPYFMIVVDTSGSMGTVVLTGANSCGYQHNRLGDARCAVKNIVSAYAGVANFGLATYAWKEANCQNATCGTCDQTTGCFSQCTAQFAANDNNFCGPLTTEPDLGISIHSGGLVLTPMLQDHFWSNPPDPSNANTLLSLVDNDCGNSEIGAAGQTPLGGTLFNLHRYFAGSYQDPFTAQTLPSPIGPATFNGQPAERPCRSINVILITDGDETCDSYNAGQYPTGEGLAVFEAGKLFNTGVTVDGQTFRIKTSVVGFLGATIPALNNIAAAGGTGASYSTTNEAQLSQALSSIIASALKPETCDNADNNCNGCADEGFGHYANLGQTCCAWSTTIQRTTCFNNYLTTITQANPKGDLTKLPCTTVAQAADPTRWLCYNPGETCDNVDNNGDGTVDETITKCGSPLHCPTPEVCNGRDEDCNGLVDDGNVCPAGCSASPEICDGCDNDCDGIADNGVTVTVPCGPNGPGEPPSCQGTQSCKPQQAVATPGACVPNGGFAACTNQPQTETCDSLDNDCDGVVDNNVAPTACTPNGTSLNLVYGGVSQCQKGQTTCLNGVNLCTGFVGPGAEVCDGLDNDCDGQVDEGVADVGQACGTSLGDCQQGVIACVAGALVCQGGRQPQPEICDGLDNNCDGAVDGSNLCTGGQVCRNGQCVTP